MSNILEIRNWISIELIGKVRIISLTISIALAQLILISNFCRGQVFDEKYVIKDSLPFSPTRVLNFANGDFTDVTTNVDFSLRGRGTYKILDKKLVLKYRKISNPDSSCFKITSLPISWEWGNVLLNVQDRLGRPMAANATIRNQNDETLFSLKLDSNVKGNIDFFEASKLSYLVISWIGYTSVILPVKELLGKRSEILVQLSMDKATFLRIAPKEETYNFEVLSPRVLRLYSPKTGNLIFKKL